MRIIILNWRSIKDPLAGGAELATFEHAKRWVKNQNAEVTWISPPYKKDLKHEIYEGIRIEYVGKIMSRHMLLHIIDFIIFFFAAIKTYLLKYRNNTDVIIDEIHGIPYFTPLYARKKSVLYVCEVAGNIWDKMYPFPFNLVGKFAEKFTYLIYKKANTPIIAISKSTKEDIIKMGIPSEKIDIIYCGIENYPLLDKINKETDLTVIFLNRLVKMKGIERALKTFAKIKRKQKNAKLWIVGQGEIDYIEYLKQLATDLNISNDTKFWGYVNTTLKYELLRSAHVLINASYKEGWGLVNLEANTQGTPSVAFNVPGNKESIKDGISGYIVNSEDEMADKIIDIYKNNNLFKSSISHIKNYDWDMLSANYYKILESIKTGRQK